MMECFSLISFDDILLISVIASLHNFQAYEFINKRLTKRKKASIETLLKALNEIYEIFVEKKSENIIEFVIFK